MCQDLGWKFLMRAGEGQTPLQSGGLPLPMSGDLVFESTICAHHLRDVSCAHPCTQVSIWMSTWYLGATDWGRGQQPLWVAASRVATFTKLLGIFFPYYDIEPAFLATRLKSWEMGLAAIASGPFENEATGLAHYSIFLSVCPLGFDTRVWSCCMWLWVDTSSLALVTHHDGERPVIGLAGL